jgi:hypothetical protein
MNEQRTASEIIAAMSELLAEHPDVMRQTHFQMPVALHKIDGRYYYLNVDGDAVEVPQGRVA